LSLVSCRRHEIVPRPLLVGPWSLHPLSSSKTNDDDDVADGDARESAWES